MTPEHRRVAAFLLEADAVSRSDGAAIRGLWGQAPAPRAFGDAARMVHGLRSSTNGQGRGHELASLAAFFKLMIMLLALFTAAPEIWENGQKSRPDVTVPAFSMVRSRPGVPVRAHEESLSMQSVKRSVVSGCAALPLFIASSALAQAAVEWKVSDGGNGHWYQVVSGDGRCWTAQRDSCVAVGGHLATITSQSEDQFVRSLNLSDFYNIGGYQPPNSCEPDCGWAWVTGEEWSFARWAPGQPENWIDQDRLAITAEGWHDGAECPPYTGSGFVIEWSADCNGDGIVDYGQILSGELADFNGNNIPDCCEAGAPCVTGPVPVEWRQVDGGNQHWYSAMDRAGRTWDQCRRAAEAVGGHLVTITSSDEWQFIRTRFAGGNFVGGGLRSTVGATPADGWEWCTREPWSFTAWAVGSPDDAAGIENALHIYLAGEPSGWNDMPPEDVWWGPKRILIEHEVDCNADGIVDFGQILRGELADTNGNGVPDLCESIRVPADHATIQAAINAATPIRNTILVSEGTYAEAIDFNGKAVTLRAVGARANTIIDGTGKTTSVVRAVTGETAATVLEGFTIRNGPVGSERNSLRLGGGMYIANASPTVRNCAFVNNAAGYGGGLYGLYSNTLLENCTFSQNFATTDAGGLQFFGGRPVVRNCVIADNLSTYRGGGVHLVQYQTGFPTLEGCTVTGNRSQVAEGGGVSVVPDASVSAKCVVAGCVITGNTSQGRGGGLHAPANTNGMPRACVILAGNTICSNLSAVSKRENTWLLFEDGGNSICDCFSDVDGNRTVDFGDLAFTLLFVGDVTDPEFIQPDQDMNGVVDLGDIALLLLNFGDCPAP